MNIWKEITTLMNPIFMSISEILCFIDTYMLSSFHSGVWTVATGGHRDGAHEEGQSLFRTIVTAWGRCHCTHHLLTAHEKKRKEKKIILLFSLICFGCILLALLWVCLHQTALKLCMHLNESAQIEVFGMRNMLTMSCSPFKGRNTYEPMAFVLLTCHCCLLHSRAKQCSTAVNLELLHI